MSITAYVTGGKHIAVWSQSNSGVIAINPLVAFYDMEETERWYSFILLYHTRPDDEMDTFFNVLFDFVSCRGQESAGIVTSEGTSARTFNSHKGMGLINNIFNDEAMRKLKGNLGIGHTR
jgi:hypothetical protein